MPDDELDNPKVEVIDFDDKDEEDPTEGLVEDEQVPDDKKDILWALTGKIEEMSLEEKYEALRKIREMRKVRIAATKKKTQLDYLLAQLKPEMASSLLKQLESQLGKEEKDE